MSSPRAAVGRGVCAIVVAALGCGGEGSGAAPSGSGAPAVSGAPASPGASGAAAAAPSGGKLVHVKQSMDECTFDFDVPEALKQTDKDGVSFTMEGTSFSFIGFVGQSLYGLDQLAGLAMMGSKDPLLVKETANGLNLVVQRNATPSKPVNAVSGQGEEAEHEGRQLGCSFLCYGVKEREAETIAMCRSVRIKYDASKSK